MRHRENDGDRGIRGLRGGHGPKLGSGFFNEVYMCADPRYVVKVAKRIGPLSQPLSLLVRFHMEHRLVAAYFRTPVTYHVRLEGSNGVGLNVTLQQLLLGRLLKDVPDAELRSGKLCEEVARAVDGIEGSARVLGWLPDVIGGQLIWGLHDVRNSTNFLLDEQGKLWLLDPSSFFFWFSRRNPIGWIYTSFLLRSARRLRRVVCRRASG